MKNRLIAIHRHSDLISGLKSGPLMLVALVIMLMLPASTFAFSYPAHAVICELAYKKLSKEAQAAVDLLVSEAPVADSFASLCGWPDRVRKQDEYKHTSVWHYVNVRRGADKVVAADCPASGCVTQAISNMQARLRNAPESDWQALAFLGHFVADVHQPMHVSYADDRGGNRTRLYFDGDRTNLHAFWDREVPGLSGTLLKDSALIERFSVDREDRLSHSEESDPLVWATGSLRKTQAIYRDYHRGMRLSMADITDDQRWLRSRMALASDRLAGALERSLLNKE